MNSLFATTKLGTVGELIVQLRLLAFGVQAAPPIKDSGNDLIAIRVTSFRSIQVKTTRFWDIDKPDVGFLYHILAIVHIPEKRGRRITRDARIFLFSADAVPGLKGKVRNYPRNLISERLVGKLWS